MAWIFYFTVYRTINPNIGPILTHFESFKFARVFWWEIRFSKQKKSEIVEIALNSPGFLLPVIKFGNVGDFVWAPFLSYQHMIWSNFIFLGPNKRKIQKKKASQAKVTPTNILYD